MRVYVCMCVVILLSLNQRNARLYIPRCWALMDTINSSGRCTSKEARKQIRPVCMSSPLLSGGTFAVGQLRVQLMDSGLTTQFITCVLKHKTVCV